MNRALLLGCVLAAATAFGGKPAKSKAAAAETRPKGPVPSLSGVVKFDGPAPKLAEIDMSSDPNCGPKAKDESLAVQDGKLAHVLVRVVGAPKPATAPTTPVIVDQKQCTYTPRVTAAMSGQHVMVRNQDGTLHNVHAYVQAGGGKKSKFNKAQTPGSPPISQPYDAHEGVLSLKCDIHPWMQAWVVPVESPFFAVTGSDGTFAINGLPPGTYTVEAWHERLGTKSQKVTIPASGGATADFTFAAK